MKSVIDETTSLLPKRNARTNQCSSAQDINSDYENGYAAICDHDASGGPSKSPHVKSCNRPKFVLCYAALAEPLATFCIFPFISEMVSSVANVPESSVGLWVGLIESQFSVVQMVLTIFFGQLSDRFGRKPVLSISLAGLGVTTALFGLSRSLWHMVLIRSLAGMFGSGAITIRIMVAESSDGDDAPRMMSWFMFARNIGLSLGLVLGGALYRPCVTSSATCARTALSAEYPYLLATLVPGVICVSGAALVLIFAEETILSSNNGASDNGPSVSAWSMWRLPPVRSAIFVFGYTMFLAYGHTAVLPVFLFTRVTFGGLGANPALISYYLAVTAVVQSLCTLVAFPRLQKRLGILRATVICTVGWLTLFASSPAPNEALRLGWTASFYASGVLVILACGVSAMSFTCVQLMLNEACPSPRELATVNALALTVNSAARAVAPALFTSVQSIGVKLGFIHGHLIWVVLFALVLPLLAVILSPSQLAGC